MKKIPLWKVLLFVFIVLPVFLCLLAVFIIPLILILLLVMPLMAKRFTFRAKNFGREYFYRGGEAAEDAASRYDAGKEEGEIVDVEGIVVDPDPEEEENSSSRKMLPPK